VKLSINSHGEITVDRDFKLNYICKELGIKFDPSLLNEGFFYLKEEHKGIRTSKNRIKVDKEDVFAFTIINSREVKFMRKVSIDSKVG
ncbi:MAG: hypothetical protein GX995_08330, partial [Clostridiales bacterium]|nr:hypothetical protein [Clostridiales bacterium]